MGLMTEARAQAKKETLSGDWGKVGIIIIFVSLGYVFGR